MYFQHLITNMIEVRNQMHLKNDNMVNIYNSKTYCTRMFPKNLLFYITFLIGILHAQLTITLGTVECPGYASDIEVAVIVNNPNNTITGMQFDMLIILGML